MAIVTPPAISALPTPPDPNDRSTFNARAYPWSVAQQTFATQVGAVASNVYSNALDVISQTTDIKNAAGVHAVNADTARSNAVIAQGLAETARNLAQDWASKPTAPVSGGLYSAKYYAELAQGAISVLPSGTVNDVIISVTDTWSSNKLSSQLSSVAIPHQLNMASGVI